MNMIRFCKGVRAGDEWVYTTNSGNISRIIVGFDDESVFYRSYGDICEKRCKADTSTDGSRARDWSIGGQ